MKNLIKLFAIAILAVTSLSANALDAQSEYELGLVAYYGGSCEDMSASGSVLLLTMMANEGLTFDNLLLIDGIYDGYSAAKDAGCYSVGIYLVDNDLYRTFFR